jgi:hypothetical protein
VAILIHFKSKEFVSHQGQLKLKSRVLIWNPDNILSLEAPLTPQKRQTCSYLGLSLATEDVFLHF